MSDFLSPPYWFPVALWYYQRRYEDCYDPPLSNRDDYEIDAHGRCGELKMERILKWYHSGRGKRELMKMDERRALVAAGHSIRFGRSCPGVVVRGDLTEEELSWLRVVGEMLELSKMAVRLSSEMIKARLLGYEPGSNYRRALTASRERLAFLSQQSKTCSMVALPRLKQRLSTPQPAES